MKTLSIGGQDRELLCADVRDDLAALALRALDDDEASQLQAHLASCPECEAVAGDYLGVVDALNASVPPSPPPAALKSRLMRGVAELDTLPPPMPMKEPIRLVGRPKRRYHQRPWMAMLAMAALLVVLAGVVAVIVQRTSGDDAGTSSEYANLQAYLASGGVAIPLAGRKSSIYDTSTVTGRVVTLGAKSPILEVSGCPPSGAKLDYRVWVEKEGKRTPVGRLIVGADGWGIVTLEVPNSLVSYDEVGVTVLSTGVDRQDVLVGMIGAKKVG